MIRREPRAEFAAWRVFRVPALLALLTALGLLAALFGTGPLRWFSWCALGLPVLLSLAYPLRSALRRQG